MADGQLVTVTEAGPPVSMEQMKGMLEAVEWCIRSVLKNDLDYGTVPGTNKPTLYKAGAEKLCALLGLSPEYEILEQQVEPFRDWEYTVDGETRKSRGYFRYQIRCSLRKRDSGTLWANGIAECDSTERGKELVPANTIIKMAEKRAYVAATQNAAFVSDRFTADLDDYHPSIVGPEAPADKKGNGEIPPPKKTMVSRYDSVCAFCGKKHIVKGKTEVAAHPTMKNKKGDTAWGALECYAATFGGNGEKTETGDESPPDDANLDKLEAVLQLETDVKEAHPDWNAIEDDRKPFFGTGDISKQPEPKLEAYEKVLRDYRDEK